MFVLRSCAERLSVQFWTNRAATPPTLFTQDRQPSIEYLCIPEVSSEHREYVPWEILPPKVIASNKLQIIPGGDLVYFAMLSSAMHMGWMRTVAGRLESRYSYSPAVYYSFPWPDLKENDRDKLIELAKKIRDQREAEKPSTLSDMYDPDFMKEKLRKAHETLDKFVARLYRCRSFLSERERIEYLFELYDKRIAPLAPSKKAPSSRAPQKGGK